MKAVKCAPIDVSTKLLVRTKTCAHWSAQATYVKACACLVCSSPSRKCTVSSRSATTCARKLASYSTAARQQLVKLRFVQLVHVQRLPYLDAVATRKTCDSLWQHGATAGNWPLFYRCSVIDIDTISWYEQQSDKSPPGCATASLYGSQTKLHCTVQPSCYLPLSSSVRVPQHYPIRLRCIVHPPNYCLFNPTIYISTVLNISHRRNVDCWLECN